jgi:hypothetical protein
LAKPCRNFPPPPPRCRAAGVPRRIYYIRYLLEQGEDVFIDTVCVTEYGVYDYIIHGI